MKYPTLRTLSVALLACAAPLSSFAVSAANCSGLKSGSYAVMNPQDPDPAWRVNIISVNAETLVVTDREGDVQLTAGSEPCAFKLPQGGGDLVVSKKGVVMVRGTWGTDEWWSVGLPLKKATVADTVGDWNFIRQETNGGTAVTANGVVSVAPDGSFTVSDCLPDGSSCSAAQPVGTMKKFSDGGLKATMTDGGVERFFLASQNDGSKLMIGVGLDHDAITVLAPVRQLGLPTSGEKFAHWQVQRGRNGVLSGLESASFKVLSVDPATQGFTRKNLQTCRVEAWSVNQGRDGVSRRPGGSFTDCSDGQVKTFSPNLSLSLRDSFGVSAYGWQTPTSGFFGVSIVKGK